MAYGTTGNGTGRIIQKGLRGHGENIYTSYAYDALGRVTSTDYPGPGFYDQDVSYVYDNYGQVKEVNDANTHSVRYQYDALGRVVSQGDQAQALTMQYDGAGRRKRLTWSDGFYVTYDYDGTGSMIAIRENGGGALASFTYEALGRRASLALANGSTTNYSYNSGFGLTDLDINLYGTTRDLTVDFTYNPAGQIATRLGSNGNYAWAGHASVNRNYGTNGLNQYTAVGAVTPTYDVKGNLSSAPTIISNSTYAYNVNNILVASFNGSTMQNQFYPDPIGRMKIIGTASAWTRGFEYDGGNIVTERRPSDQAIMHRYVFGPGDDEPLVWYDYSSGTLAKKYLTADERGSIIAVTSNSGSVLNVNTYDDFGVPASGNMGMFGYTGQAWIAELGMYHYKARTYSPTLGRFLQTDPIGYGDGMNLYNYVGADPINATDPSGKCMRVDFDGSDFTFTPMYPGPCDDEFSCFGTCGLSFSGYTPEAPDLVRFSYGQGQAGDTPQSNPCGEGGRQLSGFEKFNSIPIGILDALSFGEYSQAVLPEGDQALLNDNWGYNLGVGVGAVLGFGRIGYAGAARAAASMDGASAVAYRNGLKRAFRLGAGGNYRMYTYEQMLAKYGSDKAVAQAASRTSPAFNKAGVNAAASATAAATRCGLN